MISYSFLHFINFRANFISCFYDGMDSYAKSWLSFIVPTYFFLVTGFIMFLCSKSSQMAKIFGTNITKVLATLFQFSYTLLIESVSNRYILHLYTIQAKEWTRSNYGCTILMWNSSLGNTFL